MARIEFGGAGGSAFTQYDLTSGPISRSSGRAMANGSTKCGIRLRQILVGGNGASRTGTASLAGSSGSWSAPNGSPTLRSISSPSFSLVNGGSGNLSIKPNGSIRIGRAGGGNTSDGHDLNFSGTIGGSYDWYEAPTAPLDVTVEPAGPTAALVSWAEPADDGDTAISGYRITYANNAEFDDATNLDVADSSSRLLTDLAPGQWWVKVAAHNEVTVAAGTSSVYSSTESVVLVGEIGDLDGWAGYGTDPAGLTPVVAGGLRRGSVYPLGAGAPDGLLREIECTGAGSVLINSRGIQRTFTGLVIGYTYRLEGTALSLRSSAPAGNLYRWAVDGVGAGDAATITDDETPEEIPAYTFVATGTSHLVQLQLNEAASWSGDGWFEAVAFYGITLTEIPNTSPYRLQDVALESSLLQHFTVACDTVGAVWWVDSDDITQFRQVPDDGAIRAIFTDARKTGELEYGDIAASYDTRNVVNRLAATNHGRDAETGNTADVEYAIADETSVDEWGVRAGEIAMSLRSGYVDQTNLMHHPIPASGPGWSPTSALTGSFPNNNPRDGGPAFRGTRTSTNTSGLYLEPGAAALDLEVGEQYTIAVWVRSNIAATVELIPRRDDATTPVDSLTSATLVANTWTRLVNTFTVADSADTPVQFIIRWTNGAVGNWLEACDPVLVEGDTAGDYLDGNFDATADVVYEWLGDVNASPSVRRTFALLNQRLAEILEPLKDPRVVVSSLTWNAQQNPALAASLDVQDRIRVRFRGVTNDYRIVGLHHVIRATSWLVTFDLAPS